MSKSFQIRNELVLSRAVGVTMEYEYTSFQKLFREYICHKNLALGIGKYNPNGLCFNNILAILVFNELLYV